MRELRHVLIPGTISKAMDLGKVCRLAAGADIATQVAHAGQGAVVFTGTVSSAEYQTEQGFTIGQMTLQQAGDTMKISVKNENVACWLNNKVFATIPDLICLFDQEAGCPVANPDVTIGQLLSVVILPAPTAFTSQLGLSVFGPSNAGVQTDFKTPLVAANRAAALVE